MNRREAFRRLMTFAAGSPLLARHADAQAAGDDVNGPVNVHEFEAIAKRKLNKLAYDFIAGGVEDELTLQANRAAYKRLFLSPRAMVDVSEVDTSLEILGMRLDAPIVIAPTGGKNLVLPNAETVVARAASKTNTLICTATDVEKLLDESQPVKWWSNTTGQATKTAASSYARRVEDIGAKAIVVTVDNQYQSNRDRNNRKSFRLRLYEQRRPQAERGGHAPQSGDCGDVAAAYAVDELELCRVAARGVRSTGDPEGHPESGGRADGRGPRRVGGGGVESRRPAA
jgi:hypothetical protein